MKNIGVMLLNMGGPTNDAEVKPFLKAMFADPDLIRIPAKKLLAPLIIALRTPIARRHYGMIKGGSPLLSTTLAQAEALETLLSGEGRDIPVRVGMRYTAPRIDEAMASLISSGCDTVVCVSMYPQYCKATTGSSVKEVERVAACHSPPVRLKWVDRYFDDPDYVEAVADTVRAEIGGAKETPYVLFSAHGVPTRMVTEGDPYVGEIEKSVAAVAARLDIPKDGWGLSFQSRVGPISWVGPATEDVLAELAKEGVSRLLFVPISFTADNLETLYDLDIILTQQANALGIRHVSRSAAVNVHPGYIEALAKLVRKAAGE